MFGALAYFHGHAHHGQPEGHTARGVPVYNVALPVLKKAFAGAPPVRILEIPRTPAADQRQGDRRVASMPAR
jgi:hypothetical protein